MKRVVLGLSGGVDSAVAAYLLKKQGYEVICVFMRNWDSSLNNDILGNPTNDDDVCPQEKDYQDAQAVATHLGLEIMLSLLMLIILRQAIMLVLFILKVKNL